MSTDQSPAEALRAAAAKLREDSENTAYAEVLAIWLEETADISGQHERELDYSNEPDTSYCLDCLDEECDGLRMVRAALDVARVILGETTGQAS